MCKMAPALSRSLYSSPLTSIPFTPVSSPRNQTRLSHLRSAFLPRIGGGRRTTGVSCAWNLEKICNRFAVRCDAAVAEKETTDEEGSGEKYEYQVEVSRLMDLVVHSLYSHKEVFLRELVSNASDALDKLRFSSVTEHSLLGDGGELEIRIKPDPNNGTITITDAGIGMTKEELIVLNARSRFSFGRAKTIDGKSRY